MTDPIAPWLDETFAAAALVAAVVETWRWRRGAGKVSWIIAYGAFAAGFIAWAHRPL